MQNIMGILINIRSILVLNKEEICNVYAGNKMIIFVVFKMKIYAQSITFFQISSCNWNKDYSKMKHY